MTGEFVKNSYREIPDWVATGPVEHIPVLTRSNRRQLQNWDDFPWAHKTLPSEDKVSQVISMGTKLETKYAGAERCASAHLIYYRLGSFGIISLFTARLLAQVWIHSLYLIAKCNIV
jgi:hypothetical protein